MDVTLEQVAKQVSEVAKQVSAMAEQLGETEKRLATHVDTSKDELKHQARLNIEELKTEVKLAAEGYGATLQGIERELADLNEKVDTKFADHDLVLTDHNRRIVKLESTRRARR